MKYEYKDFSFSPEKRSWLNDKKGAYNCRMVGYKKFVHMVHILISFQ